MKLVVLVTTAICFNFISGVDAQHGTKRQQDEERRPASVVLKELLEPSLPEMTDQEKFQRWKKPEKVIILTGGYAWWANSVPDKEVFKTRAFPEGQFVGKTGVVVDTQPAPKRKFVVLLDDTREMIKTYDDSDIGFFSELEIAQSEVGKTYWAKASDMPMMDAVSERQRKLPNLSKLTVSRVEWGDHLTKKIRVYLRTQDSKEVYPYGGVGFAPQYHFDSQYHPLRKMFYSQDPRKLFPIWPKTIWALIEKEEVAIGMTSEMVKLACGSHLRDVGFVLSPSGREVSPISECHGKKFFIENGKVTRYVEAR